MSCRIVSAALELACKGLGAWCTSLSNSKFNDIRLIGDISHCESIYTTNISKAVQNRALFHERKSLIGTTLRITSWSYIHLFKYTMQIFN